MDDRLARGRRAAPPAAATVPARYARKALAGAAAGVILLLTGWVWGPVPSAGVSPPVAAASAAPLAALMRATQPRPPVAIEHVPRELPFVEPDATGRLAYSNGELEQALEMFRRELADHPSDAESRSNAAQVLVRLGRPAEALPLLAEAVALDENRWAYRFNLARCHGLLGDWTRAAAEYRAANELFPADYATLFNLGQALHRGGQEEEAVRRYREAIALVPDDASFHLALGVSEERLGNKPEAAASYRRFLELSPDAQEAAAVRTRADRLAASAPAGASSGQGSGVEAQGSGIGGT